MHGPVNVKPIQVLKKSVACKQAGGDSREVLDVLNWNHKIKRIKLFKTQSR